MKISTDPTKINELLTRGVENIFPNKEFLEKELKSGRQLTLYTGYDPTAPTLHIGHGITMLKLRLFQELGHKIIFLIGDFTGMIGDPSDKTSARQQLTHQEVMANCKLYQKQAETILDFGGKNPVELKYNSEWSGKLSLEDGLKLASHFTVQRMIERDMFQKRLTDAKPIYIHEFLYPVLQAYDSVAMNVDGEVGGNDQTFNMLAGRDLMKDLKNKEKFVLTMKLLADVSGKKMGKSEGNMIAFTDSPEDMFGKVMRWSDDMVLSGFELCTAVPSDQIKTYAKELKVGKNPRDIKMVLAYEITKMFLGEKAAERGKQRFVSVIQSKETPDDLPEIKPSKYDLILALVESKLCFSKGDARRAIEQGGVQVNGVRVETQNFAYQKLHPGDVIQKGKRFFVKVK